MTPNHTNYKTNLPHMIKRKKAMILGITLLGLSSTALILQNTKPTYSATTQLIFSGKDAAFIKTQTAFIGSNNIAKYVIKKLNLVDDPYFNINAKQQNPHKFKTINTYETKLDEFSNPLISKELEPVITHFLNGFSATIEPNSYILNLEYKSDNPHKSAHILNNITANYIDSLNDDPQKHLGTKERKLFTSLKANLVAAESKLAQFKQDLSSQKPATNSNKALKEIKQAKIEYKAAKANLEPFINKKGKISLNPKAAAIQNSNAIQKLKLRLAQLNSELETISPTHKNSHKDITEIKSQIDIANEQIKDKAILIIARIKSKHDKALSRLESLQKPDNTATNGHNKITHEKLSGLQAQIKEASDIFEEYEQARRNLTTPENQAKSPAIQLSGATASPKPISPNKPLILGLGTSLSFILAILLAIFIEKNRNTFLSGRQLEESLDLPCQALIPRIKPEKGKSIASYVVNNPTSPLSEAVRSLRLILKLRAEASEHQSKVITFTSSFQNEGKTTLSSWMASLAAKSGERVILVDCDLRRPSIHKSFGHKNTLSLVEYLGGKSKLEEVIDTNDPSGLHIIYGRSAPGSALDLISSEKMENLIRSLRKSYDLVILDTPACMAASDARALEKLSDQLVYIVAWNKTSHEIVHNGISQFTQFGKAQISTVLTNIDPKKHVQFGYGEAINYYGHYK